MAPYGMHYVLIEWDRKKNREWFICESKDLREIAALTDHIIENPLTHMHSGTSCLKIMCVDD